MAEKDGVNTDSRPSTLRDITDRSLRFLATASNETLGACAVGLCASTYLVLGRVGLVFIGAVGGIVLHATWERQSIGDGQSSAEQAARKRRELGIEVAKRALEWRQIAQQDTGNAAYKVEPTATTQALDYSEFQPATREALGNFTDAVIKDYVKWWYGPILPDENSFPTACRQTFTAFVLSLSNHLSRKRNADPFLDFLANSTSIIIVFLNELSAALRASQRQEPEEAVRTYLQYQPESNLANVLSATQQDRKLDLVSDNILQSFLDSKAYNFPPSRTFLREVLAKLILAPTVTNCAKPEWINGWIVYLLEDGEPELLNVIDAGVEDMGNAVQVSTTEAAKRMKDRGHQRRVSRAEEAMQAAMLEARRMNEMIAEDEARRKRQSAEGMEDAASSSTATTEAGMATPTTSDESVDSSTVFDSDGVPQVLACPQKAVPLTNNGQLNIPAVRAESDGSPVRTTAASPSNLYPVVSQSGESTLLVLTLHNASITIFDDSGPNDRSTFKQKPMGDYLLQIEPASSRFPGWMISRKYVDFEQLHESLRRIAIVSGVSQFGQKHQILPTWKAAQRAILTQELERYLRDALRYERLAESETMKKFLDKEAGLEKVPIKGKNVLDQGTAALENVGKGFINVLGQGGKGIAGGGKAVLGGVQGVFGAVATGVGGPKKVNTTPAKATPTASRAPLPRSESYGSRPSQDASTARSSFESSRNTPPLPARPTRTSTDIDGSRSSSRSRGDTGEEIMNLPPTPSQMMEDYTPAKDPSPATPPQLPPRRSTSSRPTTPTPASKKEELILTSAQPLPQPDPVVKAVTNKNTPITDQETRISIELIFAIITELYSLSGAWTIRLSLLAAAKTFLLRPNNPQLDSIRSLLQDSVIDANFSDAGLASHIEKLRENCLPTEEELKTWPAELTAAEKEKLRIKARKLLVERGMPQALTSVMGAAASGEALGRVFDCLQVEEVARGLIFALMLQALRAATQ